MKLSIITVVLNGMPYIENTLRSVLSQGIDELEYIVIDGGSSDGTLDLLRKQGRSITHLISEPDGGIYEAMNKGLALAKGSLVGIQNSDDYYEAGAFEAVLEAHAKYSDRVIHGLQRIIDDRGEIEIRSYPDARLPERMIPHSTCFVPKAMYDTYGLFDERYRIAGDYDLMLRFKKAGVEFQRLDRVLSSIRRGGLSTQKADLSRFEAATARFRNGYMDPKAYAAYKRKYEVRSALKRLLQ